jgi:GNAT superfamily N-acetyltransferase
MHQGRRSFADERNVTRWACPAEFGGQRLLFRTPASPPILTMLSALRLIGRRQIRSFRRRVQQVLGDVRYRRECIGGTAPLRDLTRYEWRASSQNGEDGIVRAIFARIGHGSRYYVEFGVEDGRQCNTRHLREAHGWTGLLMDGAHEDPAVNLHREFITAENIEALFTKYDVPREPDLLSIDIDGNDYYVWRALAPHRRPRVVVVEYNAMCGPIARVSIVYEPAFRWAGTDYMGASLQALVGVARDWGYTLVACDSIGVNAFFVRDDLIDGHFERRSAEALYRPPGFSPDGERTLGHPADTARRMQPV